MKKRIPVPLQFLIPKEKIMNKKLCLIAIVSGLILWGCAQEAKKAETPASDTVPVADQAIKKAPAIEGC
jgi:hypothetical protein